MSGNLRKEVLKIFKILHRTRLNTFQNDDHALQVVRNKINDEYRKNMNIGDVEQIKKLNETALAVEKEVRTRIIQAVEKEPGKYEVRIKSDNLVDNTAVPDPTAFSCNLSTKTCNSPPAKKEL
ncbi:complex III assembly factor LYRM7 [Leptopilina boulardi]|uniref:complex III assembly factor LYRM7 n=1 Tax=Leptopilina boulardi TaxID=63433 RepID=UPI0021F67B49|nr:complex III assembly factor LYRM7 [Leptopilina boulardi]XP_051164937.1 complex III assembly factor LYRM7 [Leptopilina boulardi]XP_051164938.1 complex III assembly factor LYRM7 [Leptopilina boulardi]